MKQFFSTLILSFSLFILSGCYTFQGPQKDLLENDLQSYISDVIHQDGKLISFKQINSDKVGKNRIISCDVQYEYDETITENEFVLTYTFRDRKWELTKCRVNTNNTISSNTSSNTPFFEENEMSANWNMQKCLIKNGAVFYNEDGSIYENIPAYWELLKEETANAEVTKLTITATMYIYRTDILGLTNETILGNWGLYDYYSGMRIPHTIGTYDIVSRNKQIEITLDSYSSKWSEEDSNGFKIFSVAYTITIPSDYDGLMFCVGDMPSTVDEFQKLLAMQSLDQPTVLTDYSTLKTGLRYRF